MRRLLPLLLAAAVPVGYGHGAVAAQQLALTPTDTLAVDSVVSPALDEAGRNGLRLATAVSPDTVTVGDPFLSVVRVMAPPGSMVEFHGVELGDSVQALDTVRVLGASADSGATAAYRLVAWVAAPVKATARVRIVAPDGAQRTYAVPLAVPRIRSVLPAGAEVPPRPSRGVVPLPRGTPVWPGVAVAAVLAALLALWLAARRVPARPAPAEDPRIAALEALAAVPPDADPRFHHEHAARVLRRYLAALDAGWGEEWTSTELIARLAAGPLPPDATRDLEGILARADRVKFAGSRPGPEATAAFVARVAAWIETNPPTAPGAAAPREAA